MGKYLYASNNTYNAIFKTDTLQCIISGSSGGAGIVSTDGTYYYGGEETSIIKKIDKRLNLLASTIRVESGWNTDSLDSDTGCTYYCGVKGVEKRLNSDLSLVSSTKYGNPTAYGLGYGAVVKDGYLYAGGGSWGDLLFKVRTSDMELVASGGTDGSGYFIVDSVIVGNYLYTANKNSSASYGYIRKWLITGTTCSLVATSTAGSYGGGYTKIATDGTYLYVSQDVVHIGGHGFIRKYDLNLNHITSHDFGDVDINSVGYYDGYVWTSHGGKLYKLNTSLTTISSPDIATGSLVNILGQDVAHAPFLTTAAITNITITGATAGGNVTYSGDSTVTARGICYSHSNSTPTTGDTIISATGTTGVFSCNITGLLSSLVYYVRAYAVNSYGITYGSVVGFYTLPEMGWGLGYGLLYDKYAAINSKLAPSGWHVPSYGYSPTQSSEYTTKIMGISGSGVSGLKKIMSQRMISGATPTNIHPRWNYNINLTGATDIYGLNLFPCGGTTSGILNNVGAFGIYISNWSGGSYSWGVMLEEGGNWFSNIDTSNYTIANPHYFAGIRLIKNDATGWKEGDTMTDYDGNVYKTCMVGGYVWLAENLRVTHYNDGTPIEYISADASTGHSGTYTYPNHDISLVYMQSIAPTGITGTNISFSSFDISWVNIWQNFVSGGTSNLVQYWVSGNTWQTVDGGTLSITATGMTVTGLTDGTEYIFRVIFVDDNGWYNTLGNLVVTTISGLEPTGLTITNVTCSGFTLTWVNNEVGDIDYISVQQYNLSGWTEFNAVSKDTTGVTFTFPPNTIIPIRLCDIAGIDYFCSSAITGTTNNIFAPSGLTGTTNALSIDLSWINNSVTDLRLYRGKNLGTKTLLATLSAGTTTYSDTTIEFNANYQYEIAATCGVYDVLSAEITIDSPQTFITFCDVQPTPIAVSAATCGNADGEITITTTGYFKYYTFTLTDIWGNTYSFNPLSGKATGLTASWYTLTATIKPEYWYYTREDCVINWIAVEDTDNPAFLVGVSVKPQQCGPFDRQFGRIFYNVSGLTSGHTYSFDAFTSDLSHYYSKTGITSTQDFLLANAGAECYWVVIRDEVSGCALLVDSKCISSLPLFSQGGIKKLYVAKWSDDLDYNHWSTKDDDYFLEFEDTSFFTSTKIKEFFSITGGTTGITWYSIPVLPQVFNLTQKLSKVRQGYVFTDVMTVAVAKANAQKWTKMATVLNPDNKWVGIVQDANGFWWTFGYRHGAKIETYQFKTGTREEDNGYAFTFSAISENKILTNIDENYVINYVQ